MIHTYALIGCGRISINHIIAAQKNGFKIVALCDIEKDAVYSLMKKCNLSEDVAIYQDYHKLLKNTKPDIISIATPSGLHASMSIECCTHGVNVIVEKPLALSTEDTNRIITAAKENNVIVTVCHQNRYNSAVQKAKELVDNGNIGAIYSISANVLWNRNKEYYDMSDWRGTWEQDGGVLMNQGIHNIDLLNWFAASNPKRISAILKNVMHPYIEVEDYAAAIVEYTNGCVGIINCTTDVFSENLEETLYILGTKGTIKLGGKSVNRIDWIKAETVTNTPEIIMQYSTEPPNIYGYGHVSLFSDFKQSIENGKTPQISLLDADSALKIIFGIYKAAKNNGEMSFPLQDFSTSEMKGFF